MAKTYPTQSSESPTDQPPEGLLLDATRYMIRTMTANVSVVPLNTLKVPSSQSSMHALLFIAVATTTLASRSIPIRNAPISSARRIIA